MVIDRRIIKEIENTNKKISEMLSKIEDIQEDQLSFILKEIERLKNKKKKETKKKLFSFEVEKKLFSGFDTFSKGISKKQSFKPEKIKTSFPKFNKQSEEDYSRKNTDDVEYEKVRILRSISKKLDFKFEVKKEAPKKEEKGSGLNLLELFGAGAAGAGAGGLLSKYGGKIFKGFKGAGGGAAEGIGAGAAGAGALKYGKQIGKYAGKALRVGPIMTLKYLYDLFVTIESGYSDYEKYKSAGNDIKANDVLFRTLIGGSGNLMNAASCFLPGPYAVLFGLVGSFLEYTAEHQEEIINDKTNEIMQRERRVIELEDVISKGNKNNILQLRPSGDFSSWEYKNYNSDDWEPLMDEKTKKPLSMVRGQDRIIPDQVGNGGIQTYKLRTDSNGIVELVVKDGVAKIKIGDTYSSIDTREKGGSVNVGKKYLVGEKGKEAFISTDRDYKRKKYDRELNKIVNSFELKKNIKLFGFDFNSFFQKPSRKELAPLDPFEVLPMPFTSTSGVPKNWTAEEIESVNKREIPKKWFDYHLRDKGKMNLDFSKIPRDDKERLKMFYTQLMSEEGGFVDNKNDLGGRTNRGVAQITYDTYRDSMKLERQDVAKITKEEAFDVYDKNFYRKFKIDKIDDPRLAYLWFLSYVGNIGAAPSWRKKGINTLDEFMEIRKNHLFNLAEKKPKQKEFLKGWFGREIRLQEMFKTYKPTNTLASENISVNVVKRQTQDLPDSNFVLNTLAPAMIKEVNERN